jgi:hypothetical protein
MNNCTIQGNNSRVWSRILIERGKVDLKMEYMSVFPIASNTLRTGFAL